MKLLDKTHLFEGIKEGCIWSFNDGLMGKCYGNDESAVIILGDFAFVNGKADKRILDYIKQHEYMIIVPYRNEWNIMIESYMSPIIQSNRYAVKKEKEIFDVNHLDSLINQLDAKYSIQLINHDLFYECLKYEWSKDFVSNYKDYANYKQYGLGYVIMDKDEMIAGASSYCSFKDGIEVEIVTREDYRNRGLATIVGAKLVKECINRKLYPSWDARILASLFLAEKLGYHFSHEYQVYIYEKSPR